MHAITHNTLGFVWKTKPSVKTTQRHSKLPIAQRDRHMHVAGKIGFVSQFHVCAALPALSNVEGFTLSSVEGSNACGEPAESVEGFTPSSVDGRSVERPALFQRTRTTRQQYYTHMY
jgi:hypothetical protein